MIPSLKADVFCLELRLLDRRFDADGVFRRVLNGPLPARLGVGGVGIDSGAPRLSFWFWIGDRVRSGSDEPTSRPERFDGLRGAFITASRSEERRDDLDLGSGEEESESESSWVAYSEDTE